MDLLLAYLFLMAISIAMSLCAGKVGVRSRKEPPKEAQTSLTPDAPHHE